LALDNLFYQPEIQSGAHHLDTDESRHCARVLRRKVGDTIHVTDGKGFLYTVRLTEAKTEKCTFSIESSVETSRGKFYIHIAIAPTKNPDRTEWFVEKSIEIGVDEISFVLCDNSERAALKTDRIERLAISAMKQSYKSMLTKINHMVLLKDFMKEAHSPLKYIAYVDQSNPDHLFKVAKPSSNYIVLIGPEGDFSNQELELAQSNQYQKVSLGTSRLRTETAGVAACHILNLINV
jgi:16S rRNA (uracil1498-N3)-methyltransferase